MSEYKLEEEYPLHCTVGYAEGVTWKVKQALNQYKPKNPVQKAKTKEFTLLGKSNEYLVLLLDDKDLEKDHNELKKLGLKTTFPTYRPHVTFFNLTNKSVNDRNRLVEYFNKTFLPELSEISFQNYVQE